MRYDNIAVPFVVLETATNRIVGVMRMLPYSLPTLEPGFYPDSIITSPDMPGFHRTSDDIRATFLQYQQKTLKEGVCWFSGAKMGRVAVMREMRGHGLGKLLIRGAEEWAKQVIQQEACSPCGISFQLSSQAPARGFYEALGYEVHGDEYLEEGQPHIACKKSVMLHA